MSPSKERIEKKTQTKQANNIKQKQNILLVLCQFHIMHTSPTQLPSLLPCKPPTQKKTKNKEQSKTTKINKF